MRSASAGDDYVTRREIFAVESCFRTSRIYFFRYLSDHQTNAQLLRGLSGRASARGRLVSRGINDLTTRLTKWPASLVYIYEYHKYIAQGLIIKTFSGHPAEGGVPLCYDYSGRTPMHNCILVVVMATLQFANFNDYQARKLLLKRAKFRVVM